MKKKLIFSLLVLAGVPSLSMAVDEARLLRFPATNGNEIVFSYAGDLYKVPATGGRSQAPDFACGVRNVSSFFTGRQNDCIHRAIRW